MKKLHIDYTLFVVFLLLIFSGILFLAGASAVPSQIKTGRPDYYFIKHIIFILIGIFLGFIAYKTKISFLKKWAMPIFIFNFFITLLVFVPVIGIKAGGASRWIDLYFFTLQPSELLKISLIIYLASWFSNRSSLKKKDQGFIIIPFFLIILLVSFLFKFQPDMSTLGVIIASSLVIYFSSNISFSQFILVFTMISILFFGFVLLSEYRLDRIFLYLGITNDPMDVGFQTRQSIITIGSGGIFGLGLGSFNERFVFLPQTIGDSIFSVIASESGFIGSLFLIILFFIFFYRGIRIAQKSREDFNFLIAVGISTWICIQAFVNIGAMIGIIPITGIPLPFISYGGSHIISEIIAVGILLNISKSD